MGDGTIATRPTLVGARMTLMHEGTGLVTFETWADPDVDARGVTVDGAYSRIAWYPVLGATTWLVWNALASRLAEGPPVACPLEDLAPPWVTSARVVAWSLDRLEAYGLAVGYGGTWVVRRTCPPLVDRQLARVPSPVRAVHDVTFPGA
jgi:hypothetical protein